MPLMMLRESMDTVASTMGFMPIRLYSGNMAAQVII